jgi:HAD superfamily phosphoserine phosphatase-like hydrolase
MLLFPAIGYLLRLLDRGALKGAVLHCLFAGMPRTLIRARAQRYATKVVPARLFPAALQAFKAHLAAGDHVVVLSASPDIFVPEIAEALGANEVICTQVRWTGELLDGRLAGPNRRDHEKLRVLQQLRARQPGLPVIAYGNSAADLIHMFECEQAVYVNPGTALAGILAARGMRIVRWQ